MDTAEAAAFLGYSLRYFMELKATPGSGLRFIKRGRSLRFKREDLIQWMDSRMEAA